MNNMGDEHPNAEEKARGHWAKEFLETSRFWLRRHSAFAAAITSGVLTSIIVWILQSYIQERNSVKAEERVIQTIKETVKSECRRSQNTLSNLYSGYPTITCDMNVHRLPKPDFSLVAYLNERREPIVSALGEDGIALIRSASLLADGYNKIFSDHYFKAVISKETSTFQSYYRPLVEMCSKVEIPISIQKCPFY